jgi:guanyl-specific ribonuclease Sa
MRRPLPGSRLARLLAVVALAASSSAGCAPPAGPTSQPGAVAQEAHRSGHHRSRSHHRDGREKVDEPSRPRGTPGHEAAGAPEKVLKVLRYVDEHHRSPEGYEGGRTFHNAARDGEQALPHTGPGGGPITYREWDVNPKRPGVNRGAERLVTGSDGSAYYTADHYRTFTKVR